jgi:hypothetical protein
MFAERPPCTGEFIWTQQGGGKRRAVLPQLTDPALPLHGWAV